MRKLAKKVAFTGFFVSPVAKYRTGEEVWSEVDRANRGKNGDYRRHGGRPPALALFINASFPRGTDKFNAQLAAEICAQWFIDTYGVYVEYAGHRVKGQIHTSIFYSPTVPSPRRA